MSDNTEYFKYLDELRSGGTMNMMGAPRELQHEFGLDKKEARNVFHLWCLNLDSEEEPSEVYSVNLPISHDPKSAWLNVEVFETKEEAIKFVQHQFGADENGCICLVVQEVSDESNSN